VWQGRLGRVDGEEARQQRAFIDNTLEPFGSPLSVLLPLHSPPLSHASTRRRRALLHPHNAGRSPPQPCQAHHTPQSHLLSKQRRDPGTKTTPSLRKEPRFASSSVEGKDGKKCDKEVFKTPVHPSNLRVARRRTLPEPVHLPRLSVVATHRHVERLLVLERASATENEERGSRTRERCQATPGVRRPEPAPLRPTPSNSGVPDTMRASLIRGGHGKPAFGLRSGAAGEGSWLLARGVVPRSRRRQAPRQKSGPTVHPELPLPAPLSASDALGLHFDTHFSAPRAAPTRCTSSETLADACAHRAPHPLQVYLRYLRRSPLPEALSTVHPGLRV